MADADKLRTMVTGYDTLVPNLSASIISINAEIADLSEQWSALVFAQDGIESDLETYVETNKADYFYSYGNFGVSGTGYLTEWMGFDQETATGLAYVSTVYFTVTGDQTTTYTAGTSAVVTNSGTFTASTTISASVYNNPDTLVGLNAGICAASLDGVYLESYANWGPLWDSDATVQGYMDDWVFIDDYITHLLSSTGTYGIQDMIAKLQIARALVQINLDKYEAAGPILEPYAT